MNLNATLLGQMITFAVFVLFTMKYVWPPITQAMEARAKKIAEGFAKARQAKDELALAQKEAGVILQDAKEKAVMIIQDTHKAALQESKEIKQLAKQQADHMITHARMECEQKVYEAKRELQNHVAALALEMAQKLIETQLPPKFHEKINELFLSGMADD